MGRATPGRAVVVAALVVAAAAAVTLAGWVAFHGRIDYQWSGRPHALRRVTPVSLAAWLLLMGAAGALGAARRRRVVESIARGLRRDAWILAIVLALITTAVAVRFGAFTAAGADLYGYVSQSHLWAKGRPVQRLPEVALTSPVSSSAFHPLGYRPGATAGTSVPTYAPGLPLQMVLTGFWTVPILAGLAVWLTFAIGRRITSPAAALVAAACAATSPVFLFQMLQPMSDVPVTAWWLAAVILAMRSTEGSAFAAGLAASIAIATRPNIVTLVLPCALFLFLEPRRVVRRLALFAAGCVPGVMLVGAVNHALYGSAMSSGYGPLSTIFGSSQGALGTAWTYVRWLWDTHSALLLVLVVLPIGRYVRPAVSPTVLRVGGISVVFFAVLLGSYAAFMRFDHWTYLRFMLPAIPLLLLSSVAVLDALLRSRPPTTRAAVLAFVILMFPFAYVHTAAKGDAFALKRGFQEQYEGPAAFALRELPHNAAFIGLSQTGSLRYYAQRLTLRYDEIKPADVEALSAHLRSHGYVPWAALHRAEVADFDSRFRDTAWSSDRREAAVVSPPYGSVVFIPLH